MTHTTPSVLWQFFCILLTGVLMWLVHYLQKVSFHVQQEQRSVYVVTVLVAQLNTSALAVTLPHLSLVPSKHKSNTHWINVPIFALRLSTRLQMTTICTTISTGKMKQLIVHRVHLSLYTNIKPTQLLIFFTLTPPQSLSALISLPRTEPWTCP